MAVKIKLKRMGKIRAPYYRIVVADSRTKRDGRAIEEIGLYHPKEDPSRIEVQGERAQYWLGVGAQPTEPVLAILKLTGDWQAFKGLPAPPPLLVKEAKVDRSIAYHAAVAVAKADEDDDSRGRATTARKPRKQAESAESSPREVVAAEGGIPASASDATADRTAGGTAPEAAAEPASAPPDATVTTDSSVDAAATSSAPSDLDAPAPSGVDSPPAPGVDSPPAPRVDSSAPPDASAAASDPTPSADTSVDPTATGSAAEDSDATA